jgi:hypothetical protein
MLQPMQHDIQQKKVVNLKLDTVKKGNYFKKLRKKLREKN